MSDINRQHERSLWFATGGAKPKLQGLDIPDRPDVVVVGGGFTGLTAALHLAKAGVCVAVLESDTIGSGASGVNAGFVVPNFAKADPARVREMLGAEAGERLLRTVGAGADRVFQTVRDFGMDADAEQVGWMHIAHSPDMVPMLWQRAKDWADLGRPVRFLEADEAKALSGARHVHGALLDASGGMIHPTKYAFGLAGAAIAAGASVHEGAFVSGARRVGADWELDVAGRRVRAKAILLCTNAFTAGLADRLRRFTVPLGVYQLASEPLSPADAAKVAPTRIPAADTRSNLFTYRLDRANRLISGGMSMFPPGAEARLSKMIVERLARELGVAVPPAAYVWRGRAAMTPDFLPHLYRFGENFHGGIGCNGRGLAMTAMLGEALAQVVLRGSAEGSAIPLATGSGLPMQRFSGVAAALGIAQARFRDWRAGL